MTLVPHTEWEAGYESARKEIDALAARLAEAERKLTEVRAACDHTETGWVGAPGLLLILNRASDKGTAPKTRRKRTELCFPDCEQDCICDRYPDTPRASDTTTESPGGCKE